MIYLYSRKNYVGLEALTDAIGAIRIFRFDGESFWTRNRKLRLTVPAGSVIIPWGENLPELEDIRVLNGVEKELNRLQQYEALTKGGVKSIKIWPENANQPLPTALTASAYSIHRKYGEKIETDKSKVVSPDYYTEKVNFEREYVIHSFSSRSIRAGEKKPKNGLPIAINEVAWSINPTYLAHPWIKTEPYGWSTDTTFASTPELRAIAHKAIKLLGLTFGMVKIGQTSTGALIVISVSNCPDLRGLNAVKAYSKSITKWIGGS